MNSAEVTDDVAPKVPAKTDQLASTTVYSV